MCDKAHNSKADIAERVYNANKSEGEGGKIPFDYVPDNFKSSGFNRSGRIVPRITIPIRKLINFFKRRIK